MDNKIDTVIFDIGNVMVDYRWQKVIAGMGLEEDIAERLSKATCANKDWDEFDRGFLNDEEMLALFIENDPEIENVIRDFFYKEYPKLCVKYDYADAWIDSLHRQGYKVYFLSNFSEKGLRELGGELDFIKKGDGAVISCKEKVIKPDEKIYGILIDRYSIVPQRAVFVDDTPRNIEAARKQSLNAIQYISKEQVLEDLAEMGVVI